MCFSRQCYSMSILAFVLAVFPSTAIALDGFAVRVTKDNADIKDKLRVVGTASANTLLWAFKLSEDQQWALVKVPGSDRTGWMSVNDATNLIIPDERQQSWDDACAYPEKWQEHIAAGRMLEAAKVAEDAGDLLTSVLNATLGSVYPGYPPTAIAYHQAGAASLSAGKNTEARQLFRRATKIAEKSLGTRHADTCIYRVSLGNVCAVLEDYKAAVDAYDNSLSILSDNPVPNVAIEEAYLSYGQSLCKEQRVFDARLAFQRSVRLLEKKHGDRSLAVANANVIYAEAMDFVGLRDDAIKQLTISTEIFREALDEENPALVDCLNRLSAYAAKSERFTDAMRYARQSHRLLQDVAEPSKMQMAVALNNLGYALARLHEFDEAEQVLAEATELMAAATEKGHYFRSFPLKNRAILETERRNFSEAKRLLEFVIEIRTATQGSDHASLGEARFLLGQNAAESGESLVAQSEMLKAIRIQERAQGIDHPDTRFTIATLREILDEDDSAHEQLDLVVAEARERLQSRVQADSRTSTGIRGFAIRAFRLKSVLAQKVLSKPESTFSAVEVTADNLAVVSGNRTVANLHRGTIVYVLRVEGTLGLIKVPGQKLTGWISASGARDVVYSDTKMKLLSTAESQLDAGQNLHDKGDSKAAELLIRVAVKTAQAELGDHSPSTAIARSSLSVVLMALGQSRESCEQSQKAVDVLQDTLGPFHAEAAYAQNNLNIALTAAGRPADSLAPGRDALMVFHAMGADNAADKSVVAMNMGQALSTLSHYEASREYLEYALSVSLDAHGELSVETAGCYGSLGMLYQSLYESESAVVAFRKCYDICRRVLGSEHPQTIAAMASYGEVMFENRDMAVGRKLIDEAAAINLRVRGANDLSTIDSDYQRATVALAVRDFATAVRLMRSVVLRSSELTGADHPGTLLYRIKLGAALYDAQLYEEALDEQQKALAVLLKTLGEDNHDTIEAINAVGLCNAALGRLEPARRNFERALRLGRRVIGADHPGTTSSLFNIGEVAMMAKDYVAARPRLEEATRILAKQTDHVNSMACLGRTFIGYLDVAQGDVRGARKSFDAAARDTFEVINSVLPALSEKEQLAFLDNNLYTLLDAWLSLLLSAEDDDAVAAATATWHLNMKATSHELLAGQAKAGRSNSNAAVNQLIEVRQQLARMSLRSVPLEAKAAHSERVRQLASAEAKLAREFGSEANSQIAKREWVSIEEFRRCVPLNSVLVSFARIQRANYLYSSEATKWKADRYLAWVIPPLGKGQVTGIDLGLATTIDRQIAVALNGVHSADAIGSITSDGEQAAAARATDLLRTLAGRILAPVLSHVGDVDELILSPDSQLWTIPWAALPISVNEMAVEKYRIRFVVSGRELVTEKNRPTGIPTVAATAPIVLADPKFDMRLSDGPSRGTFNVSGRLRSIDKRYSSSFQEVKRLPGTAVEASAIRDSIQAFAGLSADVYLQEAAEETVIKSAQSPYCVVLSTHGFFLDEDHVRGTGKSSLSQTVRNNPLLRCGLLMAGCQNADSVNSQSEDGILTGLEIISSDLRGTELVVLSACETGLGDVRGGEGVAGLRQAFQLAGAKSVVASLWQVDDESTARLMIDFFQNLADGMGKSGALRQAQLTRIKARRERYGAAHPFFWAAFTMTGSDQLPVAAAPVQVQRLATESPQMPRPMQNANAGPQSGNRKQADSFRVLLVNDAERHGVTFTVIGSFLRKSQLLHAGRHASVAHPSGFLTIDYGHDKRSKRLKLSEDTVISFSGSRGDWSISSKPMTDDERGKWSSVLPHSDRQ